MSKTKSLVPPSAASKSAVAVFDPTDPLIASMFKQQGAAKIGGALWPYASTRGGLWKFGQTSLGATFEGVIIGVAAENRYYDRDYNPNDTRGPACFAIAHADGDPDEAQTAIEAMAPPASLTTKQSAKCAECPQNAWGSDPKGGRGKACKNQRRLIVLSAAKDYARAQGCRVTVPVMSVRNLNAYSELLGALGVPLAAVLTRFTLSPMERGGYDMSFAPAGDGAPEDAVITDRKQLEAILARAEAGKESLLSPPQTDDERGDEGARARGGAPERRVVKKSLKPVVPITAGRKRAPAKR